MSKKVNTIKSLEVVSLAEGKKLGSISEFYINPSRLNVSGMMLKTSGLWGKSTFIDTKLVERIGIDVVFITHAELPKNVEPLGRSLDEFVGMQVTSKAGRNLGTFQDIEVDRTWHITHIHLRDGQRVAVDPDQAVFGLDTILLQESAHPESIDEEEHHGSFFGRLFGRDEEAEEQKEPKAETAQASKEDEADAEKAQMPKEVSSEPEATEETTAESVTPHETQREESSSENEQTKEPKEPEPSAQPETAPENSEGDASQAENAPRPENDNH